MTLHLDRVKLLKIGFFVALFYYVFMTFPILEKMPVTMDEVLFAEPAKNFIENGHFGTTSLKGLFEFDTKTYWQHPLYMTLMYIPIKMFGFNCWSLKVLSAVIGMLSLGLAYKIGSKFGVPYLFPILLVFNILFIFMARIGRMEMLSLCLSLATFYFAWDRRPVAAGLLAGLALLNHPIGIFSILNLTIILKHREALDKRVLAAVAAPLALAFCFIVGDLNEFIRQYYTVQRYLYANSGWLGGPLTQVNNFINLLIGAREWIFWLLPLFLLLIHGLTKPQDNSAKVLMLIQAVSFLGLILIIPNKYINYYAALVLPYTALYVAYSVKNNRSLPVLLLLVILIGTNGIGIAKSFYAYTKDYSGDIALGNIVKPYSVVLAQPNLGVYLGACEVVGFHNVRMIMDLEKKTAGQALAEIKPDYLIVDTDIAQFKKWPLFTDGQDEFGTFVRTHTRFCGKIVIHGQECFIFEFD